MARKSTRPHVVIPTLNIVNIRHVLETELDDGTVMRYVLPEPEERKRSDRDRFSVLLSEVYASQSRDGVDIHDLDPVVHLVQKVVDADLDEELAEYLSNS